MHVKQKIILLNHLRENESTLNLSLEKSKIPNQ